MSNGTLTISKKILGFFGAATSSSPLLNGIDWAESVTVSADDPQTQVFTIAAGETSTLFNGSRTILADGTTEWTLTLSSLSSDRYRFTNTAGTAPQLRTPRAVTVTGKTYDVVVNTNQTITMTASSSTWGAVQVGDVVFIPGTTTGDSAGPFNVLNEGYWIVESATTTVLQLSRPTGTTFAAYGQLAVAVVSASQLQVFSSAGVQVGDTVQINAGFATSVQKSYTAVAVNPSWFEVTSTSALPVSAVAIPGATGIRFWSQAKRWIGLKANQICVARLNGDTGNSIEISPWQAGDLEQAGSLELSGSVFSLTIVNKSTQTLQIILLSAE